jgi:hypothetical protein
MDYFWIHFIHLLVAAFFIGSVFFEVLIVSPGTGSLPKEVRGKVGAAVGRRARKVMPFVIIILYGAGLGLAWHHRAVLMDPFASSFGTLLSLKIHTAEVAHYSLQRIRAVTRHCISGKSHVLPVVAQLCELRIEIEAPSTGHPSPLILVRIMYIMLNCVFAQKVSTRLHPAGCLYPNALQAAL